jgi:thiol-disulfide isomerase/thioredoxin
MFRIIILSLVTSFALHAQAHAQSLSDVKLPAFTNSEVVDLGKYQVQTVIINFFASWCTACIKELPELEAIKKAHPKAIFIAINAGEKPVLVKKFLAKYPFSYQVLLDPSKSVSTKWGIEELPRTLVFKAGKLIYNEHIPPRASLLNNL